MNSITIHGKLTADADMILVKTIVGEKPMVVFNILDSGLPYQKAEPMIVEVHFMEEAASHIYEYLNKNKEVFIIGHLRHKEYTTGAGEKRTKFFVSAKYVGLIPLYKTEVTK